MVAYGTEHMVAYFKIKTIETLFYLLAFSISHLVKEIYAIDVSQLF